MWQEEYYKQAGYSTNSNHPNRFQDQWRQTLLPEQASREDHDKRQGIENPFGEGCSQNKTCPAAGLFSKDGGANKFAGPRRKVKISKVTNHVRPKNREGGQSVFMLDKNAPAQCP